MRGGFQVIYAPIDGLEIRPRLFFQRSFDSLHPEEKGSLFSTGSLPIQRVYSSESFLPAGTCECALLNMHYECSPLYMSGGTVTLTITNEPRSALRAVLVSPAYAPKHLRLLLTILA